MIGTACLDAQVGPTFGQPHDIALVQAMLAHIQDPGGLAYWDGRIDGHPSDLLTDTIMRFQEESALLTGLTADVRSLVTPASRTFDSMRRALDPRLRGLSAVQGTPTVYVPPMSGEITVHALTDLLRRFGWANRLDLGLRLSALVERIFQRYRIVIRFPVEADPLDGRHIRVHFHGLKWITEQGCLLSTEVPGAPVPEPIWDLVIHETGPIDGLTPRRIAYGGCTEVWLLTEDSDCR